MPPRPRYSAAQILAAALKLTRAEGIATVTARSVAAQLGCSTGPIFTCFASMEALHEQLMEQIIALFVQMASSAKHDDPLLGAGIGWLQFATKEPRLYEAVFLRHHPWNDKWGPVRRQLAERMATHPRYAHLDRAARFALVGRTSVVIHGLGLEIWSGRLPAYEPSLLLEAFAVPVIDAALAHGWTTDLHAGTPLSSVPTTSSSSPTTSSSPDTHARTV